VGSNLSWKDIGRLSPAAQQAIYEQTGGPPKRGPSAPAAQPRAPARQRREEIEILIEPDADPATNVLMWIFLGFAAFCIAPWAIMIGGGILAVLFR